MYNTVLLLLGFSISLYIDNGQFVCLILCKFFLYVNLNIHRLAIYCTFLKHR